MCCWIDGSSTDHRLIGPFFKFVHVENSPYIAKHTGGRLVVMDGVGHAINSEEHVKFNALLDEFIQERVMRGG